MKKPLCVAVSAALLLGLGLAASTAATSHATFTAALVSDVGKFNDKSFNQNQLAGPHEAKQKLGITTLPLAVELELRLPPEPDHGGARGRQHRHGGRLPARADAGDRSHKQFPNIDFTITDDSVKGPDFEGRRASRTSRASPTRRNEAGCLVGYLAAEMVKKQGGKQVIGAVGGLKIPPVNDYIVGYKYCAKLVQPEHQGAHRLLERLHRPRTSARRSRRTRSARARRSSSRSPAAAASAS